MVGRGTRLADNKMMFTIYDYTDATRLFGNDFKSRPTPPTGNGEGGGDKPVIIEADGFEVEVAPDGQYVVSEVDGQIKRITIEDYRKGIAQKLLSNINSFEDFRNKWIMPQERKEMLDDLLQSGYSAEILRQVDDMSDYDLFDILTEIAFGNTAKNKMQRVLDFQAKERNWLSSLPQDTREVIIAIVNQFAVCGTDCIENNELFKVYDVMKAGGMKALNKNGNAKALLLEAKLRLFAA
jgi:type I restriction enzyme R subunit